MTMADDQTTPADTTSDDASGDEAPGDGSSFSLPPVDELPGTLDLGAFSISLNVADLDASTRFYEALGFEVAGGDREENYLILKNGETTIGIFHGMFEDNILTFNPGLTNRMTMDEDFVDVREIQQRLEDADMQLVTRVDEDNSSGPASITLLDPDGNPVLIDQFF
ncbi:MAG TPA: VOC family protein [Nitriliruptoraceae bacterium]|nr:VOC family protein [Nitriliruptoraceae bacterium]